MGLMDILSGMQNGPGDRQQQAPSGSGGMSPTIMAMLGLLAYKAIKGGGLSNMLGGSSTSADPRATAASSSGGLNDILGGLMGSTQAMPGGLGGMLGGLLGGTAAGSALNGGLRNLIGDIEKNGQGDAARSWVSNGPNQSLSPGDLAHAIGADDIDAVARQTGMPRDQMLSVLSEHLPEFVNQLTPHGRLPTETEASRW